jgi:hypothetical protein
MLFWIVFMMWSQPLPPTKIHITRQNLASRQSDWNEQQAPQWPYIRGDQERLEGRWEGHFYQSMLRSPPCITHSTLHSQSTMEYKQKNHRETRVSVVVSNDTYKRIIRSSNFLRGGVIWPCRILRYADQQGATASNNSDALAITREEAKVLDWFTFREIW